MSQSAERLVAANREQVISESDSFTPRRYAQFFAHLRKGTQTILDVGCNTGRGGRVLKELDSGLQIAGLDCVPERLEALDLRVYRESICAFANQIPVAAGSFDAICAGEFIEHVPPDEVDGTLAEFFRILKLRGRLLMTTPNPNYLKNRIMGLSVLGGPHLSQHFPECLRHRLRVIGFSRVRLFGSGRVTVYLGQWFPWLSVYGSYLVVADKW